MISKAINHSHSVVFNDHKYYDDDYDFYYGYFRHFFVGKLILFFVSPIIFAKLISSHLGFIYVGDSGFLISSIDSREFEFRFLKRANKPIISYFVGNDIRSQKKMQENFILSNEENYGSYLPWVDKIFQNLALDKLKYKTAQVSLKYSSAIFSSLYDQASYLNGNHYPVSYFYDFQHKTFNSTKFEKLESNIINIFHAPSSPIIKGTQVIRTVMKMLEQDGFKFNYIEKSGNSNEEILEQLNRSHIVVNELYAFMPGVFAIEAMANSCAVLTRADPKFEKSLEQGAENAWIITPSYLLYKNLRFLLENPEAIKAQALSGFNWAAKNASLQSEGPKLQNILNNIIISK